MESPLYVLEWKQEPVSPASSNLYESEILFFDDSTAADNLTAFDFDDAVVKEDKEESKADIVNRLLEDLDHLDQLDDFIKEELFSSWLEEKVDLPIFENIQIDSRYAQPRFKNEDIKPFNVPQNLIQLQTIQNLQILNQQNVQTSIMSQNNQDTSYMLQEFDKEFDKVLDAVEMQLTPPQSPPLTPLGSPVESNNNNQVLTTLTPIQLAPNSNNNGVYFTSGQILLQSQNLGLPVAEVNQRLNLELAPGTPQPDVAHELAVVDELVRSRAENMVENWNNFEISSPINKATSSILSPCSPSSSSSSGFSEYSSDPEWIPETVQSNSSLSVTTSNSLVDKPTRGRKRSTKPYSRIGPEDKKSRKKEQNKNAATRYRLKKKAEIEEILGEEKQLIDHKTGLENQVGDLQREIKCLKGLMRDLFKAKGLL